MARQRLSRCRAPAGACLRDVAQPERTALEAGLLAQGPPTAAPFMVCRRSGERGQNPAKPQGRQLLAQLAVRPGGGGGSGREDHPPSRGRQWWARSQKGIEVCPIAGRCGRGDAVGAWKVSALPRCRSASKQQPLGRTSQDGLGRPSKVRRCPGPVEGWWAGAISAKISPGHRRPA